jgi:UDP:flavonoid glycosyltransferase YjiC (YdhE family)
MHWLNKQPVNSVIYVAFGSLVRIPPSVIDAVAHALSQYSFIWSLKLGTSLPSSLSYLDSNRQLVLDWTPQRAILAHPSVSLFISHGGWNSLIEGMLYGKAILTWPIFADQLDNAQQLVELGIARQVSDHLQTDIEHMLNNGSYVEKAKQIQQILIKARDTSSKEQIADIARCVLATEKQHHEL